eukprot:tig00020563_g11205.t1
MTNAEIPKLQPGLEKRLAEYRAKRAFDPKAWIEMKCAKLNDYMKKCGLKACVTSVSGGIDSAVILALCGHAQKMPGSPITHNVGVCQPIHSSAWALERGKENVAAVGADLVVVDQTDLHTQLCARIEGAAKLQGNDFARGQLRSYMRTPCGYYVAQLYSCNGSPAIVMGTGNMDEDGYLAYFCKAGDGVVDVQLISDLHKSEVFKVAAAVGVPENTRKAPPSADLWDGQTDEGELGFSYDFVELWTGDYVKRTEAEKAAFREGLSEADLKQLEEWGAAAERVHKRNFHKIQGIQNL